MTPAEFAAYLALMGNEPTLLRLIQRPAWQRDALCREYPAAWFFSGAPAHRRRAVDVCSRCSVRGECLAFAVAHDERGVWGGTTEVERRRSAA